jgi:hypothetical protein
MRLRWIVSGFFVLLVLGPWLGAIWRANKIAQRNFGPAPCWFVHAVPSSSPPRLMPGPRGAYVPNPFRQLNRRFVGLGVEDFEVFTPHFAVAALDSKGRPTLWGWSYWNLDFWSLSDADQAGAFYDTYTNPKAIFDACPHLRNR